MGVIRKWKSCVPNIATIPSNVKRIHAATVDSFFRFALFNALWIPFSTARFSNFEVMPHSPLHILTSLATKERLLICGIMSGTSVDAVDVALVSIQGSGTDTALRLLHYAETLYAEEVQQRIFDNMDASTSNVYDICVLDAVLARTYADAVSQTCADAGLSLRDIDLVGMHGQTLHHLPTPVQNGPYSIRSTFQAGSGSMLAALLGMPVVSDFRAADIALGGQGAPLVPYAEYLLCRSDEEDRVLLNIGGISNITWMPARCREEDVRAWDLGPGNMVVDALMRLFYGREFDEAGEVAASGRLNVDLLSWMMSHPFFKETAPKSTGREAFGRDFVDTMLQISRDLEVQSPADLVATASECTVRTIVREIQPLVSSGRPCSVYISGGGVKNNFFLTGLRHGLSTTNLYDAAALGIPADAKEAMCFALLANEWLHGNAANLPNVTGASRKIVLGSLSIG